MDNKPQFEETQGYAYDGPEKDLRDSQQLRYGEAADIYGDAETAERYGYVARG